MNDNKLYKQAAHLARSKSDIGVSDIQRDLCLSFVRAHDALSWLIRDGVVSRPKSNGRCTCGGAGR